MLSIEYPVPDFMVKREKGRELIFDRLRRRWLVLTPEEWVRQNFIQYLVQALHYPPSLIAQEKTIRLGELNKRFDILVYNSAHEPWMMVECKAPSVALDDQVLQQLLRYHLAVPVGLLVITNGHASYGWEKKGYDLVLLHTLPGWAGNG